LGLAGGLVVDDVLNEIAALGWDVLLGQRLEPVKRDVRANKCE
jgi:hypothetical protein